MQFQDHNAVAQIHQGDAAEDGAITPLLPSGELSIYTVAELRSAWLAWVSAWVTGNQWSTTTAAGQAPTAERPTLVGSAIDTVDAAGVQLLLALDQALGQGGHRLLVLEPSDALISGCDALGLGGWLAERSEAAGPAH